MLKNSPSKIISISDNFNSRANVLNRGDKNVTLAKIDVNQQNNAKKINAPVCWSEESTPSYKNKKTCDIIFEFDEEKMNFSSLIDDKDNNGGSMLLDKLNENTFDLRKSTEKERSGSNEKLEPEVNYDDVKNISITEKKTKLKETKDISKKDYRSEGEDSCDKNKFKYKNEELNSSSDFETDEEQKIGYCQKNLNAYMRKEKSENNKSKQSDNRSSSSDNGLQKTKKNKLDPNYNNGSQKINNIMNLLSNKNNYENISEDIAENIDTKVSDNPHYIIPEKIGDDSQIISIKDKLSKKQSEFSVDSKIIEGDINNQLIYEPETIMKRNAKFLMTDSAYEILEDYDENDLIDYNPTIPQYGCQYDPYNLNHDSDNQALIDNVCNIFEDDPDFAWYNYKSKVTEDQGMRNTMGFKDDIEFFNETIVKEERNKQSFLEFFDSKSKEMQSMLTVYNYTGLLDLTNSLGLNSMSNKMYSNNMKARNVKFLPDSSINMTRYQNEMDDDYILNINKLLQNSATEAKLKNEPSPTKKENTLVKFITPLDTEPPKDQEPSSKEESPKEKPNLLIVDSVDCLILDNEVIRHKNDSVNNRSSSVETPREKSISSQKRKLSVPDEEELPEVIIKVPKKNSNNSITIVVKENKEVVNPKKETIIFETKQSKKKRKQTEKKNKKKQIEKQKNEPVVNVDQKEE